MQLVIIFAVQLKTSSVFSSSGSDDFLLGIDETSEEREKLDFICSSVIVSVKARGSALITIDRLRLLLQLLEQLLVQMENSDVKVECLTLLRCGIFKSGCGKARLFLQLLKTPQIQMEFSLTSTVLIRASVTCPLHWELTNRP